MTTLYYFMDPMCSWCYGFNKVLREMVSKLPADVPLRYVMGGLAPDSDEPMPEEIRQYVQGAWRMVAARTGATFNFEFWNKCTPRRSTYPACRAVIAAGLQNKAKMPEMITAIQSAYYQQARNPSEMATLVELATEIGLDAAQFAEDLTSEQVEKLLQTNFSLRNRLGVQGFPALVLEKDNQWYALAIGYTEPEVVIKRFETAIASALP